VRKVTLAAIEEARRLARNPQIGAFRVHAALKVRLRCRGSRLRGRAPGHRGRRRDLQGAPAGLASRPREGLFSQLRVETV
jgi:hypothetical protein